MVWSCELPAIKAFVEQHHYSHSVFGVTVTRCFKVTCGEKIVGAAIFGKPAGMGVAEKYGVKLVELRRFVLTDECPRNSESRVLGQMLRQLKRQQFKRVLSYADPAAGHLGIIYRATGFEYRGTTAKRKHIMWKGKKYPDRNVHQTKFPFHLELRAALADGSAIRIEVPGKHTYLKVL